MKQAWVKGPDEVGLSKDTLFLESKSGKEAAMEASKAPLAGLVELEGTIWVQTTTLQSQPATQEWLAGKLEHALNGHCAAVEELLVALTSAGRGFRVGLGVGLDSWAEMVPQGEWGRIRAMREEASKEEEYE